MEINQITKEIIGCAIEVHKTLGQGLLETVYEKCLALEMQNTGLKVQQQIPVPIKYKETTFDSNQYIRFLIEDKVIVELKVVEENLFISEARIITLLKFTNLKIALLFDFNVPLLKNGIRRYAN